MRLATPQLLHKLLKQSRIIKALTIGSTLSALIALTGCTQEDRWTLFYQQAENAQAENLSQEELLQQHLISGYYATSEQCLLKGAGMEKMSYSGKASFVCGQYCQIDGGNLTCQSVVEAPSL